MRDLATLFLGRPDVTVDDSMADFTFAPREAVQFQAGMGSLMDVDISTVDPLAGIQQIGGPVIPLQNIETELMNLRARMPYLPIIQRPQRIVNVFMGVTPAAINIDFSSSDRLVRFTANSEFYVSFDGAAMVPNVVGAVESGIICNPPPEWHFTGGIKQISVYSPNPGAVICASFMGA